MAMTHEFKLDTLNGTSSVDIYANDEFLTTFSFHNSTASNVTLSARPSTDINVLNLEQNISTLVEWIHLINITFHIPNQKRDKFKESLEKKPQQNKLLADFKVENDIITNAEFNKNTQLFSFQPRQEIVINYLCFQSWVSFLSRFLEEGKRF